MPDLDLESIKRTWLVQCGPCDYGLVEMGCNCPTGDYRPVMSNLVAEVEKLRERLSSAELVCRLVGMTHSSAETETDRDKALTQAWMDWSHAYNPRDYPPVTPGQVAELAQRRGEIRAATVARIRERYGDNSTAAGRCDA